MATWHGLRKQFSILLCFSLEIGVAQASPWQVASEKDGVRLETRRQDGERFDELRVSATLPVAPEVVAAYLLGKYLDEKNRNIQRTFIQRTPELTIWSDVVSMPIISKRCYSMRFERQARADGGIRVAFSSLSYLGELATPDCIGLRSQGQWMMVPAGSGTRLTYQSQTDIGGKVPASLARRSLVDAAVLSLRKVAAGAAGLPLPRGIGD